MNAIQLNSELFKARCNKIMKQINRPMLIFLGKSADVEDFNMNSALFHYLLGYEFPETIIVLKEDPTIITSPKKAIFLQQIEGLKIVIKNKDDSNLQGILDSIASQNMTYGIVDRANCKGDFCSRILDAIKSEDITKELLEIFLIKENNEIDFITKSGVVSNYLLQKGIDLIRDGNFSKDELENFMNDRIRGINNNAIEFSFDPQFSDGGISGIVTGQYPHFIRLGSRYKGYCTEVARPFLQDLTVFYEIQKYVIGIIRPGTYSNSILQNTKDFIAGKGFSNEVSIYTIGLLEKEMDFNIGFELKNNMAFCINIDNVFCNTFLINDLPIFVTKKDSKDDYSVSRMKFRNKSNDASISSKIKEHQKELLDALIDERVLYYKSHKKEEEFVSSGKNIKKIAVYAKDSSVPRSEKIFLDWENFFVIIPILSYSVPFHISAIKNVSVIVHNDENRVRVNFKDSKEVKEMTCNSNDGKENNDNFDYDTKIKFITCKCNSPDDILSQINDMRKEYNKPSILIKDQPTLREKFKKYALTDVYMRTDNKAHNKKILSNLELHENGFRYNGIVILFSNIKNIFFQTGDFDNRAILHFNLKEPIMHGKLTSNVQFFKKWNVSYLDTSRREDERLEMLHEQEEEEENMRINSEFFAFVERIEQDTNLKIQIPEKGFLGVHSKEAVSFYTTNDCVVSLNEIPFFVLNFDEVEVLSLERVTFVTKTFDCVFVFKNKARPPLMIGSVETTKLNYIKEIMDSHNIVFMETKVNINWNTLMPTIYNDPLSFYESGGWSELLLVEEEGDSESSSESSTTASATTDSEDSSTSYDETDADSTVGSSSVSSSDGSDDSLVSKDSDYDDDDSGYDSESSNKMSQKNRKKRKTTK